MTEAIKSDDKSQYNYVDDEKSFAETLFTDAFNGGVHKKSLDATNYVLGALFICALFSLIAYNFSIHFIVILFLALGLTILMNVHREAILEVSEEFFRQEQAKKAAEEAALLAEEEDDEDYEEDDDEDEEYQPEANNIDTTTKRH